MASRTIFTDIFRISYAHLTEAFAHQQGDTPKFQFQAMFPKAGVANIAKTGVSFQSSHNSILQALNEVTTEEWGVPFDPATAKSHLAVQFPPEFHDGDLKPQKDDNGNPLVGTVNPNTAGFIMISLKNEDPIGVVGPDSKDIDAKTVYSGCWCRAQIEVSAFVNKSKQRIISVKPIKRSNVL
jgi:Protein of unknown function (DUF2815).